MEDDDRYMRYVVEQNQSMFANSEHDHMEKNVRRNNLIQLFLQGIEVEKYISTHLYGELQNAMDAQGETMDQSRMLHNMIMETSQTFDQSMMKKPDFDHTLFKQKKIIESQTKVIQKMSWFQTYVALVKGYCGACILFTPKAFANGGYLFSPIALCISGLLTSICAAKLIQLGQRYDCFCYSAIVKKCFGQQGRILLDIMIFCTQYSFTISSIVYQA
mmetsp:Transcript_12477/g.20973  ORF Transcript_12477/g.20973 Transcript_12477/m.20973 type:complete len:217 (+) Transcript_12477:520-1170(+)